MNPANPPPANREESEQPSTNDDMMLVAYGSLNPSILQFPHVVLDDSLVAVRIVLDVVDANGGIWGGQPLVDAHGEPYVPPWEPDPSDFILWEVPQNQTLVIDKGTIWNPFQFTMLIDSRTSPSFLAETYSFDLLEESFVDCIERVSIWIAHLKWVLIPVNNELGYYLFAVREDCAIWIDKAESRMRKAHGTAFRLKSGKDRFHWTGPE